MLPLFFVALAQAVPVQGPAPVREEKLLNGLYLIVNEEVVTQGELYRELVRRGRTITNEAERQRVFAESHRDFVRRMLMSQAGRDLGFPTDRIEAIVGDEVKEMIESSGSAMDLGQALQGERRDIEQFREERKDYYFSNLWMRSIDGSSTGVGGRFHVDRFVPPSRLHYLYERQPADRIFPSTVQFQEITITVDQAGSGQKARDMAVELRSRALAGEDFGELAAQHHASASVRWRKGLSEKVEIAALARARPELAPFFEGAAVGELTEPIPLRVGGELAGYQLYRLFARDRREHPEFSEAEVQDHLRKREQTAMGEWRRDVALGAKYEAAYIWPQEAAKREPAGEKPEAAATGAP
jgi:hypothetical protein